MWLLDTDRCLSWQVGVGDFVSVCPENESEAVYIAQIIALWEDLSCNYRKQFHARWFSRSSDTVLGEVRGRNFTLGGKNLTKITYVWFMVV